MSEMTVDHHQPSVRHDPSVAPHTSVVVLPGEPTDDPTDPRATPHGLAITVMRREGRGERTVGVFELVHDKVTWRPVVDVQRIVERSQTVAVAAAAAVAAVAIGRAWSRTRPEVGRVTMGPAGWLSVRGGSRRDVQIGRLDVRRGRKRAARAARPLRARMLRARRIS